MENIKKVTSYELGLAKSICEVLYYIVISVFFSLYYPYTNWSLFYYTYINIDK